jgi:hypothetical protein
MGCTCCGKVGYVEECGPDGEGIDDLRMSRVSTTEERGFTITCDNCNVTSNGKLFYAYGAGSNGTERYMFCSTECVTDWKLKIESGVSKVIVG